MIVFFLLFGGFSTLLKRERMNEVVSVKLQLRHIDMIHLFIRHMNCGRNDHQPYAQG